MRCPYCQTEIEDNASFCVKCGQAISQTDYVLKESNAYWSKAAEDQREQGDQYRKKIEEEKKNIRSATVRRLGMVITIAVAIALVVFIVISVNSSNQEKLKVAEASVIGKTYKDVTDIAPQTLFGSYHPEIKTLVFNNDGTADYTYSIGDYTIGSKYDIVSTPESGTYKYEMTIDFFGNISIKVYKAGGSWYTFAVETRDDGTVWQIEMFD